MKHPYEEYEASRLWEFVKSSIEDLVENNVIELFTPIEYIVGHICKNISSTDISSSYGIQADSVSQNCRIFFKLISTPASSVMRLANECRPEW